ncbi:MAG: response regulator, partial [Candidatus Eisenbacteria bacterium]|nr:response regulator [Candidatus Eisenbacteria bacterium]
GVAHDFNNLLTVISGYTELLSRSAEDARVSAHAEQIRGAAERAADLTQQLLAFSRQQPLQPRVVEANSAITSMNALLRRLIGEDIALSVHLSPDAGRIRVDPAQIEQVVMNLAVNARDAMPEGGALTLRTEHVVLSEKDVEETDQAIAGNYVMLAVSDTGTGIDKEALDRIFEPFYSTKELGRGTGLGLSVVYGVVEQHGGFVEVDSEAGGGTTFRVYLPEVTDETDADRAPVAADEPAPRGAGEQILLVEDEDSVRSITARMLEEGGYGVTAVADIEGALEALADEGARYDLVFTDVVLPDRSGVWLAEHLAEIRPDVRLLLGSGYTDDRTHWSSVRNRGLSFIRKPYRAPELLKAVRGALTKTD